MYTFKRSQIVYLLFFLSNKVAFFILIKNTVEAYRFNSKRFVEKERSKWKKFPRGKCFTTIEKGELLIIGPKFKSLRAEIVWCCYIDASTRTIITGYASMHLCFRNFLRSLRVVPPISC